MCQHDCCGRDTDGVDVDLLEGFVDSSSNVTTAVKDMTNHVDARLVAYGNRACNRATEHNNAMRVEISGASSDIGLIQEQFNNTIAEIKEVNKRMDGVETRQNEMVRLILKALNFL